MDSARKRLAEHLEQLIAKILEEAAHVPADPVYLPALVEMGNAVHALETLKRHLTK